MSRHIVFRPRARREVQKAASDFESLNEGWGDEFLNAVEEAAAEAALNPEHYPRAFDEFRRVRLRLFPYTLVYRATDEAIVVLACVRNPRRRLPTSV
jgi:hypothetical protein